MTHFTPKSRYLQTKRKKLLLLFALCLLTFLLFLIALGVGTSGMLPHKALLALFGKGNSIDITILRNIRLPRAIGALLFGAGLAASGLIMQSTLHNPMASPSTLGIGNAAVFGANFAIVALSSGSFHTGTITVTNPYTVTICAFVAALCAILLILALAAFKGYSPQTILLAGVALSSLFSACTTILQYFAKDTQVTAAVFWTFGDLSRTTPRENTIYLAIFLPILLYFILNARNYNALSLGEEYAKSLGVNVTPLRVFSLILASALCAASVCFVGIIGFVGLCAPFLVKPFFGADHRFCLPASLLSGSALLLFADILARSILSGIALPVGAITSILGAPILLKIILSRKGGSL